MLRLAVVAAACMMLMPASALAATPAFSVHKNGTAQTIVGDTPTKLTWTTEVIDTNTNFATDRFTPTIPGNYLIVVSVQCAQPGACVPAIYKNGALYAASKLTNQTFADQSPQVTAIVGMNGSTDYVEAFATSSGSSIVGAATQTYFTGSLIDGGSGGGGGSSQWSDGSAGAIYYNAGNVGIGTAPSSVIRLHTVTDTTDQTGTIYGTYVSNMQRATTAGSYTSAGAFSQVYPIINSGIANSGWGMGHYAMALRNGAADIGSLASLYGTYIAVGHNNGTATARTSSHVVGLQIQPYAQNGTITNLFGIYLASAATGGTLTNNYGIYQADAAATNYFAGPVIAAPPMMILADEKPNTTAGGTCTAGSWMTRVLNATRTNTINGGSLSGNEFTLPVGTYLIRASSPGFASNRFQGRLYNVTDAAVVSYGTSEYSAPASPYTSADSKILTTVAIAAAKAFRIEHRCNTSQGTNGLGVDASLGGTEVYTMVEITKIQ